MLKYEEELHFNDYYEKYQKSTWVAYGSTLITSIIWYTALFCLLRMKPDLFPDIYAWDKMKIWFAIWNITFVKADIVYYLAGFILITCFSFQLKQITIQNHLVRSKENKIPEHILADGYYAKKRHPMYGTFIFLYMGVLLSLRSLNGIILTLILISVQYVNAIWEEKRILQTDRKYEYQQYQKTVKAILFDRKQSMIVILLFVGCAIGFLYN